MVCWCTVKPTKPKKSNMKIKARNGVAILLVQNLITVITTIINYGCAV